MKTIGIDGRCLTGKPAGVASFLITAINNIIVSSYDFKFVVFSHKKISNDVKARIKKNERLDFLVASTYLFKNVGVFWFFFKLPFVLNKTDINFFWGPAQVLPFFIKKKIKTIVTIHDVVFLKFQETMSRATLIESKIWTNYAIRNADLIWTVSNYTKTEIESSFPERKCKEIFVGSDIDYDIFKKEDISFEHKVNFLKKFDIQSPFILFVGTIEPRKNLQFLLKLMPELAKSGISLLVVGAKGWSQSAQLSAIIDSLHFPKHNVKFTGYLTTGELVSLYGIANALVSTSLNEGFGLPLREALACGCPVICPNNSGMIEVVENKGVLMDGWDEVNWIKNILRLVNHPIVGIIDNQFRWIEFTKKIIEIK